MATGMLHRVPMRYTYISKRVGFSRFECSIEFSVLLMAPLKGNKRKRKVENDDEEKSLIPGSPGDGFGEWWDVVSKKAAGMASTSREVDSFRYMFGMSRETFDYICSLVQDNMLSQTSYTFKNGNPMSLQDQVAIALKRLASDNSLDLIGDLFGTNRTTVSQLTWRFVEAIEEKRLLHLGWPSTEEELAEVKSKFLNVRGMPNCCGAIDTTHISWHLISPDESANLWLDTKGKYSMFLQTIVDADLRFLDVVAGWPGQLNKSQVFQRTSFYKKCKKGEILSGSTEMGLREHIIGDKAFPCFPWLTTPCQDRTLSKRKRNFNKRLTESHSVARMALVRLKETWKMIKKGLHRPDISKLPVIILACCILHNILIDKEGGEDLKCSSFDQHDPEYEQEVCETVDEKGSVARNKLVKYFSW